MSAPIKTGGPAFPCLGNVAHNSDWVSDDGMSLRDWFAGQALAGMMANPGTTATEVGLRAMYSVVAQASYICADAMIAEREKGGAV